MLLPYLQLQILAGRHSPTVLFIALFIFSTHFSFRLPERIFLKEQYQSGKMDKNLPFGPPLGKRLLLPSTPQYLQNTSAPTPVHRCFSTASAKDPQPLMSSLLPSHLEMQVREIPTFSLQVARKTSARFCCLRGHFNNLWKQQTSPVRWVTLRGLTS